MKKGMYLWLLVGDVNGWDTFDSCIVAARTSKEAKSIHPSNGSGWSSRGFDSDGHDCSLDEDGNPVPCFYSGRSNWATHIDEIKVSLIGKATKGTKSGVILASFLSG